MKREPPVTLVASVRYEEAPRTFPWREGMKFPGWMTNRIKRRRELPKPYVNRWWSPAEDEVLRFYAAQGGSFSDVAKALPGRTRCSVAGRAKRLGVKFGRLV